MTFRMPRLDAPLRCSDSEVNEICLRQCDQGIKQIMNNDRVLTRLRSQLRRTPWSIPSLEEAARELGMSGRTLQRHLEDEGTTYRQVVNDIRLDLASGYFRSSGMTSKEVGYSLGFEDTNAFRRAFKSWTGQTIHEFRQAMKRN